MVNFERFNPKDLILKIIIFRPSGASLERVYSNDKDSNSDSNPETPTSSKEAEVSSPKKKPKLEQPADLDESSQVRYKSINNKTKLLASINLID